MTVPSRRQLENRIEKLEEFKESDKKLIALELILDHCPEFAVVFNKVRSEIESHPQYMFHYASIDDNDEEKGEEPPLPKSIEMLQLLLKRAENSRLAAQLAELNESKRAGDMEDLQKKFKHFQVEEGQLTYQAMQVHKEILEKHNRALEMNIQRLMKETES